MQGIGGEAICVKNANETMTESGFTHPRTDLLVFERIFVENIDVESILFADMVAKRDERGQLGIFVKVVQVEGLVPYGIVRVLFGHFVIEIDLHVRIRFAERVRPPSIDSVSLVTHRIG